MAATVAGASEPHIFVILGAALFVRDDLVEAWWELYTPLLANKPKVAPYAAGSWGRAEADALLRDLGRGWTNS